MISNKNKKLLKTIEHAQNHRKDIPVK